MTMKYTRWLQNTPNGRKIDQMAIKYTNISHRKALQNLPKVGFLVSKYMYHLATLEGKVASAVSSLFRQRA
jgi:hypothetical protein